MTTSLSIVWDLLRGRDGWPLGSTEAIELDDVDAPLCVGDVKSRFCATPALYARFIFGMLAFFLAMARVRETARRLPQFDEDLSDFAVCGDGVVLPLEGT